MPMTKEEKNEYNRLYQIKNRENLKLKRIKNKEHIKERNRLHYLNNTEHKKERNRLYHIKNKTKLNEQNRLYRINNPQYAIDYRKTDQGKKSNTIASWRRQGILCFDWDMLYDLFLSTTHCEFCLVELNTNTKTTKCLDHNHDITDRFNIRGVLCLGCNFKDVLCVQP